MSILPYFILTECKQFDFSIHDTIVYSQYLSYNFTIYLYTFTF